MKETLPISVSEILHVFVAITSMTTALFQRGYDSTRQMFKGEG